MKLQVHQKMNSESTCTRRQPPPKVFEPQTTGLQHSILIDPRQISGNWKGVCWVCARSVFSKYNRDTIICQHISTCLSWDRKQKFPSQPSARRTELTNLSLSLQSDDLLHFGFFLDPLTLNLGRGKQRLDTLLSQFPPELRGPGLWYPTGSAKTCFAHEFPYV